MKPWETIDVFLKANHVRIGPPTKEQTTGGKHVAGPHYEGRARDYGNVGSDCAAVATVLEPYARAGRPIMELFYEGSSVKVWLDNGVSFIPKSKLRNSHRDHVHVALWPGRVMPTVAIPNAPTQEQAMAIAIDPICSATRPQGDGGWIFGGKGHVYSFGAAGYFGGWDDATRARGIPCVAGVPSKSGNGYWLVSAIGEIYGFGDAAHPGNYQKAWGAFPIIGAYRDDAREKLVLIRDDGKNLNLYALPA